MTVTVSKPSSTAVWQKFAGQLTRIINDGDMSSSRDLVAYVFDHTEDGWEDQPAAWHRPMNGDIVINLGIFFRESQSMFQHTPTSFSEKIKTRQGEILVPRSGATMNAVAERAAAILSSYSFWAEQYKQSTKSSTVAEWHTTFDRMFDKGTDSANTTVYNVHGFADRLAHRVMGVIIHETGHSIYSKYITERWWSKETTGRQRSVITMFDELRCEYRQCKRLGANAKNIVRYAADIVVNPTQIADDLEKSKDSDGKTSIASIALNSTLTLGRSVYDVFLDYEVKRLDDTIETLVGATRLAQMKSIWERFINIEDSNDSGSMMGLADEWLELFPSDSDMSSGIAIVVITDDSGSGPAGEPLYIDEDTIVIDMRTRPSEDKLDSLDPDDIEGGDGDDGDGDDDDSYEKDESVDLPGIVDAITEATEESTKEASEEPAWDKNDRRPGDPQPAAMSYKQAQKASKKVSWVPVTSEDHLAARKLARALETISLSERDRFNVTSKIPPGRLSARAAVQRSAEKKNGVHSQIEPWKRTKIKVDNNPSLTAGIMTDCSGSQSWATVFSSQMSWILSQAVNSIGGRTASVAFGQQVYITLKPGERLTARGQVQASEGMERFDRGLGTLDYMLGLTTNRGVRILFVITDGGFVIAGESDRAQKWADRLAKENCKVVWIAPKAGYYSRAPKGVVEMTVDQGKASRDPHSVVDQMAEVITTTLSAAKHGSARV